MKKIVLITGATSGIGLGCARKFAENGDQLILTGRNEQRLAEISNELTEKGTQVKTLAFDVRDRNAAKKALDELPAEWKAIDVLVNNAGLALGLEPEYEGNLDELTDGLRIDVANTAIRVTNLKPGLVETNFSNIRFHGDTERAAKLYTGIKPLTGDDIADTAVYAANAPEHVQIAEVLILATHQASGSVIVRK